MEDIYINEPWELNRNVRPKHLEDTAKEIVALYDGSAGVKANFEVAMSLSIELPLSPENKSELEKHKIPNNAVVSGNANWQNLFSLGTNSGSWLWEKLTNNWPHSEVYEYLISEMILQALEDRTPNGTMFRSLSEEKLYRLTLRRYEVLNNKKYKFYFTAAPLELPFDIPYDSTLKTQEAILYHLYNIIWYFRRRIIDTLYGELLDAYDTSPRDPKIVKRLYREIGEELMQIHAQSIARYLNKLNKIKDALGKGNPEVDLLINRGEEYYRLENDIFDAIKLGMDGLPKITECLNKMQDLNKEWHRVVSVRLGVLEAV